MTKKEQKLKDAMDWVARGSSSRGRAMITRKIKGELKIPDLKDVGADLPKKRKKRDLKWRKYLETRRAYTKGKRVLIVETKVKNKETYSVSGLTASELDKVREALK